MPSLCRKLLLFEKKGKENGKRKRKEKKMEKEIRKRLEKLKEKFYPGLDLSQVQIEISSRMKYTAGEVIRRKTGQILRISRPYHDKFGWGPELDKTLKHELIHLAGFRKHDREFYAELRRIGAPRYCKSRNESPERLVYQCRSCGQIFYSLEYEDSCPECGDLVDQIGTAKI